VVQYFSKMPLTPFDENFSMHRDFLLNSIFYISLVIYSEKCERMEPRRCSSEPREFLDPPCPRPYKRRRYTVHA
jgi:hypothetical protein